MFADLGIGEAAFTISDDCLCVRFATILSATDRATVADRLTSRDDADQTARANLATLRDVLAAESSDANRDALLIAVTDYLLDR
jgi:hypothetical protein